MLTYWRSRLRSSAAPERIFDAVRAVIDATGVLKGRRRRALDSTLLDDAVATQDTVTQLVSAIRRVRRLVPEAAAVRVTAHDYDASGKPVCAWDDPDAKTALVTGLVNDARAVIAALDGVALDDEQADAVGLLALVAGQDVEPGESEGTWRIARAGGPGPGHLDGRSRVPAHAQERQLLPGRLQGPCRGRTRDRADHRLRAHPRQRR